MIGVVFSAQTGKLRRVICPHEGVLDWRSHPVVAGEDRFQIDVNEVSNQDVEFLIEQYRGRPTDHRGCAVVKDGVVVDKIVADPVIDDVPGALLVLAPDEIGVGDYYRDGEFSLHPSRLPEPEEQIVAVSGGV